MSHRHHDNTSLACSRAIADRLRADPNLMRVASENLDRWQSLNHNAPSLLACYAEWRAILQRPLEEVILELCAQTDRGQRLRQNSPFAGILSDAEVRLLRREASGDSHAA